MAKVILENLTKVFSDGKHQSVTAVNNINLCIEDREFMVLVGPSGCGKSTILRMIAGLEEITNGSISIDHRVVNKVPPKDRDIAMVFQNYALYPHMSVYDNMAFGLKLMKCPKEEIRARVKEAAEILGIEELIKRKPKALSGGQRQRVAVGRAIVRKPKVFLFDEPLSNLDAKMRVSMRSEISRLHARLESTMIYVTHDQMEAMSMGDRIAILNEGNIMQVAEPVEIYNHPANMFSAGFIGSPPMNFFKGRLSRRGDDIHFTEINLTGKPFTVLLERNLPEKASDFLDREVVFGIRPENITDEPPGAETSDVVEVKVEMCEPMGAETHLYLDTGAHSFTARLRSGRQHEMDQKIQVYFTRGKVHLFDPETETAII